ncbi:hypothetical protein QYE76_011645 [Lolium multiflorum]|uniref:C2H2-type domain-containing protein n=1 Tax=Lolium multiflorum TaxID=4521 RepID=A0AAD8TZI5_LOLMU|nr:hypothetical protein QYE76_011645 [Lolium multiflorum]
MDILMNDIRRRKNQIKARRNASWRGADHPPPPPPVIKGHDQESADLTQSGQEHSDQEDCMAILTNAVERQKLWIRARGASGGTDHPAPPPPVQKPPSAPPDAPAPREWRKRQPTGPPTGSSGTNTSTSTKPPSFKKPASIVCRVCGVRCMTASHLKMHEMGRKHRNKVAYAAGEMNVRCDVCDVPLLSKVNVEEHYAGKQHLHRVFASSSGASSYVARPPATQ